MEGDLHSPADYLKLAGDLTIGVAVQHRLATCPYPFVWLALAVNPATTGEVLGVLSGRTSSAWNDNRLLALLAAHPHADRAVLAGVLRRVQALLDGTDRRPYQAALTLAARPEVACEQIRVLAGAAGASRRLRRGLRRAADARQP